MNLKMDNWPIEHKPSTKLLGVHIDEMLTWDDQIKHTFVFHLKPKLWNGLPLALRQCQSLVTFKNGLKTFLFKLAYGLD